MYFPHPNKLLVTTKIVPIEILYVNENLNNLFVMFTKIIFMVTIKVMTTVNV